MQNALPGTAVRLIFFLNHFFSVYRAEQKRSFVERNRHGGGGEGGLQLAGHGQAYSSVSTPDGKQMLLAITGIQRS